MTLEHLMAYRPHEIVLHELPIQQILRDSLFYPDCGLDGEIIRSCNEQFELRRICSFVYADPNINEERLLDELDSFTHYRVLATRSFNPFDYDLDGPVVYPRYRRPFGRWTVYEKDPHNYINVGPERFSVLFLGGMYMDAEGVFPLFSKYSIIPKAIVGDVSLNNPNSEYSRVMMSGELPEYIYYKSNFPDGDDFEGELYEFNGNANIHYGPDGQRNVTIWHQISDHYL